MFNYEKIVYGSLYVFILCMSSFLYGMRVESQRNKYALQVVAIQNAQKIIKRQEEIIKFDEVSATSTNQVVESLNQSIDQYKGDLQHAQKLISNFQSYINKHNHIDYSWLFILQSAYAATSFTMPLSYSNNIQTNRELPSSTPTIVLNWVTGLIEHDKEATATANQCITAYSVYIHKYNDSFGDK